MSNPKNVCAGGYINQMSHRDVSGVSYEMTEMIPSTSPHLIDRSEDVIFELA